MAYTIPTRCPMRRLTLDQIYEQVSGRFPYFKKEDKSWQVRQHRI